MINLDKFGELSFETEDIFYGIIIHEKILKIPIDFLIVFFKTNRTYLMSLTNIGRLSQPPFKTKNSRH